MWCTPSPLVLLLLVLTVVPAGSTSASDPDQLCADRLCFRVIHAPDGDDADSGDGNLAAAVGTAAAYSSSSAVFSRPSPPSPSPPPPPLLASPDGGAAVVLWERLPDLLDYARAEDEEEEEEEGWESSQHRNEHYVLESVPGDPQSLLGLFEGVVLRLDTMLFLTQERGGETTLYEIYAKAAEPSKVVRVVPGLKLHHNKVHFTSSRPTTWSKRFAAAAATTATATAATATALSPRATRPSACGTGAPISPGSSSAPSTTTTSRWP